MNNRENEVEPNILGYSGYIWGIQSENLFGKSKSYLCKIIKNDPKFKYREHIDDNTYKTTNKEDFIHPKNMDQAYNNVRTKKVFKIRKNTDID